MSQRSFSGWGGTTHSNPHQVVAPTSCEHLLAAMTANTQDLFLAHGLGRSYGDSALNTDGLLIDCRFLDRLLAFDQRSGVLECEAGVSILQINRLLSPQGWMLPVTPGTQLYSPANAEMNSSYIKASG